MNERLFRKSPGFVILLVVIALSCQAWSQEVIVAMDDASQPAYSDGWQAGDNGGFGFQAWEFDSFFESAFSPRSEGEFIAENSYVDIPANGPAFGQTNGTRPYWGYTSWAIRPFQTPLQVGQTFSIDIDNPILQPLDPFDPSGVMLRMRDSSQHEKLSLLAQNDLNEADWTVFDAAAESANTGLNSGSSDGGGFNFALTLTGTESYEIALTPFAGGDPLQVSGTFRNPGDPISEVSLVLYSNGSSSDGSRELYTNNLRITEPAIGELFVWDGLGDGSWTDQRWTIANRFPGDSDTATIVNDTVTVNDTQSAANTVVESGRLYVAGQLNSPVEIRAAGAISGTGTIVGNVTNAGMLELDGGTFNATSLDNLTTGEIIGFGRIAPLIHNDGTVRAAGGALLPAEGIQAASGTIQIDPDGALDLSVAQMDSSANSLVHNGVDSASLKLGANSVVVGVDYINANFGTGNSFQPRANVTGTGDILASGDVAQHLTGDVSAGESAHPKLDFGDVHVGTQTSLNYRIKNAGTVGPNIRGAVQTAVGGGNLTDSRLTGSGVTASNFVPVPAGSESSDLTVSLDATESGPLIGQTVRIVNNFDNVPGQVLSIEGAAWNLATAEIESREINLGNYHVGDAVTPAALTITNDAPDDGFSELLQASFAGTNGGVVASGEVSDLRPKTTNATSMTVSIDTSVAGNQSGTATIALDSDGAGNSELGITSLSPQTVNISGSVFRLAEPNNLSGEPIDLGIVHVGDVAERALAIVNQATLDGFSERLNARFAGMMGDVLGTGSIDLLPAGGSDSASMIVSVDTTTAGLKNGTGTIDFVSDGNGTSELGQTPLAEQVVEVTGQVNNFASATVVILSGDGLLSRQSANEYLLDLGTTSPSSGPLTSELGMTNRVTAPADNLAGTFAFEESAFALNGFEAFSDLAAGETKTGLSVELDSIDLEQVTGTVRLTPRSENDSGFSASLAEITITLTAQLALAGDANVDGYVDVTDFNIWNDNRGQQDTTWGTGDFNGDGMTNDLDFAIWSDNRFASTPLESSVPEPSGALPLGLAIMTVLACRFRESQPR